MKLTRTTPGALGIDAKGILSFVNALEEKQLGIQSFMLIRHGQVAAEAWWTPYSPEKVHQLYSLSKSFTSTAVGFAVQEGLLSLDDSVVSFFEDILPAEPCENMRKMKVRNLLTMGTGHSKEPRAFSWDHWAYGFLTSYVDKEPGSVFTYNTPATYMLSCIVQKVTGQKVFEYLKPRLFEPLGIENIWWEESPQGVNTGGFGLNIHTEDIARFGLFLLNRGMADGKQLLNPEWIDLATSRQISNGDPATGSDWAQGYGFQFWRCAPQNVYRGDGMYGQYCVVMPDQDAVLAMTSGSNDIGQILKEAWMHLLPAMKQDVQPDDGAEELHKRLAALKVNLPEGTKNNENAKGGTFRFSDNPLGFEKVVFDISGDGVQVTFSYSNNTLSYPKGCPRPAAYGSWTESGESLTHACCAYAWQPDGALQIRMVCDTTPYIADFIVHFFDTHIEMRLKTNVGMSGPVSLFLVGVRE